MSEANWNRLLAGPRSGPPCFAATPQAHELRVFQTNWAAHELRFCPRPRSRLSGLALKTRTTTSGRTKGFLVPMRAQKPSRLSMMHLPILLVVLLALLV